MSEILKKAQEIHDERAEAYEVANAIFKADQLKRDRELERAKNTGLERAQEFVNLMIENDIPAEEFFTGEYEKRIFNRYQYKFSIAGKGWSIRDYKSSYTNITGASGLAILTDGSVREWEIDNYHEEGSGKKIFKSSEECCLSLAYDNGLELLGSKLDQLGIIE